MPGARKPHVAWPIIAFAATFVAAWLGAPGQAKARCALEGGPARAVTHVVDGETVKLDDGSEVRLAGIVAPRAPDSTDDTSFWPPAKEARSKLEEVVAGRSVELNFTATRTDRYGRQSAHVFTQRDGQRVWIQGALLSSGQARVFALAPATDCLDELMTHERIAFEARKGLWSNAAYQVRMAGDVHALMRYRNTLQLVEGVVSEVADVKGRVFLNFGAPWRLLDVVSGSIGLLSGRMVA